MAALPRVLQKLFASTAAASEIGKFGSLAAGTPETTTDPAAMQAANWFGGWFAAVIGNNSPAIEDWNAVCYVFAYQLAYLFEKGVPEWNAETTYYIGSIVNDALGALYVSKQDTNLNHAISDTAWWVKITPTSRVLTATSGTYTTPTFCKAIRVRVVGGGGGGGGCANTAGQSGAGAGGGGGGYAEKLITGPAATYSYAVGVGGAGGATGLFSGATGAISSFGAISCTGGAPGGGGSAGIGPVFSSNPGGAGGVGSGGDINISGGTGGQGFLLSATQAAIGVGGNSQLAPARSFAGSAGSHVGVAGSSYGGGGDGGSQENGGGAQAGGAGANGTIVVEEFF